jgi:hypothetical protein
MTLPLVGRRDDPIELGSGFDEAAESRALSVDEIQRALHQLRAAPRPTSQISGTRTPAATPVNLQAVRLPGDGRAAVCDSRRRSDTDTSKESSSRWGDTDRLGHGGGDTGSAVLHDAGVTPGPQSLVCVETAAIASGWVTIVAAHSGAGASTVALAIADAATVGDRWVHLMDAAPPARCGLVAAASAELGTDSTGEWLRGERGHVTLDRRAGADSPSSWPSRVPDGADLTIVDLGLPNAEQLRRIAASFLRVVVVCRPTLPGFRLTEHLLAAAPELAVVLAAVGPVKWPREVAATAGPRLVELRASHRFVTVPWDRHLEVTGPTSSALPKPLIAAGRALLELLDDPDRIFTRTPPRAAIGVGR